mmetsp:Transcript_6030/g.14718  ORF Transcript_6030/g.14718 Transcript_6030/m.14718 type:complete len:267 (-) Transcript_6030:207-1007(-)
MRLTAILLHGTQRLHLPGGQRSLERGRHLDAHRRRRTPQDDFPARRRRKVHRWGRRCTGLQRHVRFRFLRGVQRAGRDALGAVLDRRREEVRLFVRVRSNARERFRAPRRPRHRLGAGLEKVVDHSRRRRQKRGERARDCRVELVPRWGSVLAGHHFTPREAHRRAPFQGCIERRRHFHGCWKLSWWCRSSSSGFSPEVCTSHRRSRSRPSLGHAEILRHFPPADWWTPAPLQGTAHGRRPHLPQASWWQVAECDLTSPSHMVHHS